MLLGRTGNLFAGHPNIFKKNSRKILCVIFRQHQFQRHFYTNKTEKTSGIHFFPSRGALRNHSPSVPTSPSSGKPLPFFDFRRGMRMDGLQTGRKMVGRHRDLNPGPPAWESGVLAVTLRGRPSYYSRGIHSFFKKTRLVCQVVVSTRRDRLTLGAQGIILQKFTDHTDFFHDLMHPSLVNPYANHDPNLNGNRKGGAGGVPRPHRPRTFKPTGAKRRKIQIVQILRFRAKVAAWRFWPLPCSFRFANCAKRKNQKSGAFWLP